MKRPCKIYSSIDSEGANREVTDDPNEKNGVLLTETYIDLPSKKQKVDVEIKSNLDKKIDADII